MQIPSPEVFAPNSAIDLGLSHDPCQVVAEVAMNGLVVIDNGPVYGILGNARNKRLANLVQLVKGEARDTTRPLGLTIPFNEIAGAYETSEIQDDTIRELMENPDALTEHLGGLAFVRGRAGKTLINEDKDLPPTIISSPKTIAHPRQQIYPEIQIYSPAGNPTAARIIQLMLDMGGLPAMTSANYTKRPEIIAEKEARAFANAEGVPIYVVQSDDKKPSRPRSSYPILQVTDTGITIIRTGFMDAELVQALIPDIPMGIDAQLPKHGSRHILHRTDLPKNIHNMTGPELRKGILEILGVSSKG